MPAPALAAARIASPPAAALDPLSSEAALHDAIGEVAGETVVIVGHATLDVMCAVIRDGADEVSVLRLQERAEPHEADLAIIVGPTCAQEARVAIAQAQHALAPSGRVVVGRLAAVLAQEVAAALRVHGFARVDVDGDDVEVVVRAELPFFAPLGRAGA